nr:DUF359 domain-containing protein [Candidatus Njordarchaeota archaeon]
MRSRSDRKYKTAKLPESLREELSKPHGTLVTGKEDNVSKKVAEYVRKATPPKVITVGDVVTRSLISKGVKPDLAIIDGKTLRGPEEKIDYKVDERYTLTNPAGLVTSDAWKLIDKALKRNKKIEIIVEGEEDLLGIPVVLLAPKGSLMLYGQPNKGIVIITVNDEITQLAESILSRMEE